MEARKEAVAQKENKNRYINAMEIGLANEDEGISYFDLIEGINKMNSKPMGQNAEITFFNWFMDNYTAYRGKGDLKSYSPYIKDYLNEKQGAKLQQLKVERVDKLKFHLNEKYFLDGQAAKQYLDYLELQQSVKSAKDAQKASIEANKKSTISIGIAIVALIVSGVLGALQIVTSPKPPYEVKIKEDNPKVKELEENLKQKDKEVDQLRQELLKAEMMIRVLEEATPPTKSKL
ncbi:hypothetical protein V5097_11640 [Arenibacter palladensis]|uniref:hypothetical protein n=1 Tax=Arenibacter palladensis TaxID=237373 RepID=UPI002FD1144C